MTESTREQAEPPDARPEFSRPVPVAQIRDEDGVTLEIVADARERAALARLFDVLDIAELTARIEARPWSAGGLRIDGVVAAALTQCCVVTLDPVPAAFEESFQRFLAPASRMEEAAALLDAEARDELEPLGDVVDFGAIATEQAALALDPYPRSEGAALGAHVHGPPDVAPLTDEAARPFAGLAALKRDLADGSDRG